MFNNFFSKIVPLLR